MLVRLADLFFNQAAYERAIATHRFLIEVDPMRIEAARHQRRIVDAHLAALESAKAVAEIKVLAESYGPGSAWVKANRADHPREVGRTVESIEQMLRQVAKTFHAEAQAREKARGRADAALYQRAADTYAYYLTRFGRHRRATEVRFLRAEILLFKLGKFEEAGDEYLAVGKSTPVGKYHKDALYKAMDAYKKARPPGASTAGRRELLPVDRKFAEAIDLYATLFPADKDIVGVIYENGELFYRYGDYDEAIKRFGLIVTRYPDDPNAGAAGDRILEGLNKARGLREHRELGAQAQEGARVPVARAAGPPRPAHRRVDHQERREVRRHRSGQGVALLPARAGGVPRPPAGAQGAVQRRRHAGEGAPARGGRAAVPGAGRPLPAKRDGRSGPPSPRRRCSSRWRTSTARPRPTSWWRLVTPTGRTAPTRGSTPACCARPWPSPSGPSSTTRSTPPATARPSETPRRWRSGSRWCARRRATARAPSATTASTSSATRAATTRSTR